MDTYDLIITRRSTRAFKDIPLEKDLLEKLVEAARHAPSGGNSQSTHFFVITDKEILKLLAETAQASFAKMQLYEGIYPSLASSISRSRAGGYVFHYSCPALIVTANQKDYGNNIADCACALENMMILGNAMNLGTCWINQLKWLNEDPAILEIFKKLGLEENERIYGALAVGYPATQDGLPNRIPLARKGNKVTWVE